MAQANNSPATSSTQETNKHLTEEQKVQQLISYVRHMQGATFIRNGSEYNCERAADHLQSKWEKHKEEVKDANGFIDELASKSGMSGKPYQIRFADGKTVNSGVVLHQELARIEAQ